MSTPGFVFIIINVVIIFFALAMPLGFRRFSISRIINAPRHQIWEALHPFGDHAGWSRQIIGAQPDAAGHSGEITLSWTGRDGLPIRRRIELFDIDPGSGFRQRVVEDSSLDNSFWQHWESDVRIEELDEDRFRVTMSRSDHYRGAAFLIFRWFSARRELIKLKQWAESGEYKPGGIFEHPLTQCAMATLSALILWPIFGLNAGGFVLAVALTFVIALHELGHMAAFRMMGHKSARMIFIPVLGGVAIGGRPYDTRFEIAFVALMGAGFSAFLVPVAIFGHTMAQSSGHVDLAVFMGALAACTAFFNLANLIPVWKFDGGQVLRQITPEKSPTRLLAAMALLLTVAAFGWAAGFSYQVLMVGCAVMALLSLVTAHSGVKPRQEMKPITHSQKGLIVTALCATLLIHGWGVVWAMQSFL